MSGSWAVWRCEVRPAVAVPVMAYAVPAGFPSPAEDYLDPPLDFNELLVAHPAATFAVRVAGDSMVGAGIYPGDIAVVDRAEEASDGAVVLAIIDGGFTLKRFRCRGGTIRLESENPTYEPITITEGRDFEIWGVVRRSIRML